MQPEFYLASAEQGRERLTQRDAFIVRLSEFDRSARLHDPGPVSEPQFLQHVASSVKDWQAYEQDKLDQAIQAIRSSIRSLPWPQAIALIRTDGREEGGAPYTRGSAIVLPDAVFSPARLNQLPSLLLHELFHILTRHHSGLKQALYASIGFFPCDEPSLPKSLQNRRITNPDAPISDYQIELVIDHQLSWAVPLLLADSDTYQPNRGGEFFDYLKLHFYFQRQGQAWLAEQHEVQGFFAQVGRNTEYILHPEEILADNFALLMQQNYSVPNPEVLFKMAEVLSEQRFH